MLNLCLNNIFRYFTSLHFCLFIGFVFEDLSYNNFTWENSSLNECSRGIVNIVESFSPSTIKPSRVHSCLKQNFPYSAKNRNHYSLHINCGGDEITLGNITYQDDKEQKGAFMFYSHPSQDWAFSSTGNFMDDDSEAYSYIKTNTSLFLHLDMVVDFDHFCLKCCVNLIFCTVKLIYQVGHKRGRLTMEDEEDEQPKKEVRMRIPVT